MRGLILLSFFFTNSVFAFFQVNERMQQSYLNIIDLNFIAANNLLEIESEENPKNKIIILHKNYIDFLKIIIAEEEQFFKAAKQKKKKRLELIGEGDQGSPYYLYVQAEIRLQWAFLHLKFEEYPMAVYEFVRAYHLFKENQKKFPEFFLNKKGLGVIYSLIGAVPDRFQWALKLAGLKGSVKMGLSEIELILNNSDYHIYETEVLFMLSFLEMNLNNNKFSKRYINRIGDRYKTNILLNFAAARLSHSIGMNEYCIKVLENRPEQENRYPFYYLDYLQAMSYLYKLDYLHAQQYFNNFLKNFQGKNYIKSAYHKLAWICYLEDKECQERFIEQVVSQGSIFIDEDKVAFKEVRKGYVSEKSLLKARLLYDGGYYLEALDEIQKSSSIHISEYHYRLARIKSKLGYKDKEVISSYQEAYNLDQATEEYYAPMSTLQIGLIYEKKNNIDSANIYFNKCLSFSGFDYEAGIRQKAKSALQRVIEE